LAVEASLSTVWHCGQAVPLSAFAAGRYVLFASAQAALDHRVAIVQNTNGASALALVAQSPQPTCRMIGLSGRTIAIGQTRTTFRTSGAPLPG
jgi:hypothetical protein